MMGHHESDLSWSEQIIDDHPAPQLRRGHPVGLDGARGGANIQGHLGDLSVWREELSWGRDQVHYAANACLTPEGTPGGLRKGWSMQRSRRLWLGALTGALAVLVSACAPGQSAPGGTTAASAQPTIDPSSFRGKSITYVYFTDGPDEAATRTLIGEFEKQTGASVNLQIVPYDSLEQSLQARLSGNNVPDVARVPDVHPFADQAVNFSQYFGASYKDQFLPGAVSAVLDGKGDMLGVPSDLTMNGPFVNVDQFKKAGVPFPTKGQRWTWDEMIAAAKRVQAANGTEFAFAMDKSGHRVSTVLSQFGTTMIGPGNTSSLDVAKATKAVGALTDLMKSGAMSKDFWLASGSKYKGANDMFLAGAVPVYLSGNWQVGQFAQNAKFTWAAVPNPCVERCGGFPGGKFMMAFKRSKNPQLAAYFVKWMNETAQQRQLDQLASWLPTRADLTTEGITYPQRNDDMNVFLADLALTPADTYASESSPAFGGAATELVKEMAAVVAGQVDAQTAVTRLKVKVDQLVKAPGS